jgi:glycosyltransferase involved in cell wall biosynthesis
MTTASGALPGMTAGSLEGISVALATYNGEKFIGEQLESILNQSLLPREIVISDDASTDGTLAIIEKMLGDFEKKHGNMSNISVHIIAGKENIGVVQNFNRALAHSSMPLIALCDQDDIWLPNKLDVLSQHMAQNPHLRLLHSNAVLVDETGTPEWATLFDVLRINQSELRDERTGMAYRALLRRNTITGAGTMIRKDLLALAAPFPTTWLHDEWLGIVAALRSELAVLEDPLFFYRQHPSNQVGAQRRSLKDALRLTTGSQSERSRRNFARALDLHRRSSEWALSESKSKVVEKKYLFELARANYSPSRLRRILPIAMQLITGRYFAVSRGWRAVMLDLFQRR